MGLALTSTALLRLAALAALGMATSSAAPADVQELRSYRLAPRQWQFLANTDTGDAGGDLWFGLWLRMLQPLSGQGGVFAVQAAHWDSYALHVTSVNTSFGDYRSCNPSCMNAGNCGPWPWNAAEPGSWECDECTRTPAPASCRPVGKRLYPSDPGPCRRPGSDDCLRSQLIHKFVPVWYSFTAAGQCEPGAAVSWPCTWRDIPAARRVVAATCVEESLASLAQGAQPACFTGCGAEPPPVKGSGNYSGSPCWTRCVLAALSVRGKTAARLFQRQFQRYSRACLGSLRSVFRMTTQRNAAVFLCRVTQPRSMPSKRLSRQQWRVAALRSSTHDQW